MNNLRIGLAGVGFIGWFHCLVLRDLPCVDLVAVSDNNTKLKRKVEQQLGCRFYDDYMQMLENEKLDALSICLPDDDHLDIISNSVGHVKSILLEKPMAQTVSECIKIKEECKKSGTRLMIAHILRFDPAYKNIYDRIMAGEFGELIHLKADRKVSRFCCERIRGRTSVLFYGGVHDIDLVQWYSQARIKKVYAQSIMKINKKWNTRDCFQILAEIEGGTIASFEFSWTLPVNFPNGLKANLELFGTKGTAFVNRYNMGVEAYTEKNSKFEYVDVMHWPQMYESVYGSLRNEIEHFVQATINDKKYIMKTEDAISSINVVESIQESIKCGLPVEVKGL